jgi:hypothetical protein
MNKDSFTSHMKDWLGAYLNKKYDATHKIKILIPQSNLDIIPDDSLKKLPNISLMQFKPDVLGILVDKLDQSKIELVFLNRETKKFSLRELGEMLCYCRIANPKHAFMTSLKGLSPAVDKMINHYKNNKIILFNDKEIIIFRWDEKDDKIDEYSITPVEKKDFYQ